MNHITIKPMSKKECIGISVIGILFDFLHLDSTKYCDIFSLLRCNKLLWSNGLPIIVRNIAFASPKINDLTDEVQKIYTKNIKR